jgi:two-component system, cell cycle response regulator
MEINILVIEDQETARSAILRTLQENGLASHYHEAGDGIEGLKILLAIKMDLVVCDVDMPRLDGFRFLSLVRAREELRDIPVILLTGKDDRTSKVRGLETGASDYITKPFDSAELVARVRVHLKLKYLQDQLRAANARLLELSYTDHLTGLYNRRYLMDLLDREFSRTRRSSHPLSLIILDVDNFKEINDQFGHQGGDTALQEIARQFRGELRDYDSAVRFGGDEFVAVLPDTAVQDALMVAERIRKAIEEGRFPGRCASLRVTASLGVAVYPGIAEASVEGLIREADSALYRAKAQGRNQIGGPTGSGHRG